MSPIVGIAGAARNAAVALCDSGQIVAVCEQERITRTRRARLQSGKLPAEALETVLGLAGHAAAHVAAYAVAEPAIELPATLPIERLDHHHAHAATSFYTSPFPDAVVLVCDRHGVPELTVWQGDETELKRVGFPWVGPAFATVYSRITEGFGFEPEVDEHRVEALAHATLEGDDRPPCTIAYGGGRLEIAADLRATVAAALRRDGGSTRATGASHIAGSLQRHLGDLLVQVVRDVKAQVGGRHLCLGGGLFFNSYFTTLLAESGLYEQTFVPVNPGNSGVAIGAALGVAGHSQPIVHTAPLSPFLGPEYDARDIKATLDNCKLSYDYVPNGQMIDRTVSVLTQGKLVGWFQGRMEWGPRALGNRSILASPVAPFVLENLNVFLKRREPHRSYGVSICAEDAPRYFRGPATSDFMEHEYEVIVPDVLRALLPPGATKLRVQTVPKSASLFHALIRAFGDQTGVPMLVNTSFNGFHEPIVCTPRDAVRVFYGTGLDMAVIGGGFVLHK